MADKQKQEVNDEQIVSYLQSIVDKIRTEEDPLELNNYRRLFRKAVPFTLRSYFAAWILKEAAAGRNMGKPGTPVRGDRSGRNSRKDRVENPSMDRGRQDARGRDSGSGKAERGEPKDRNRRNESRVEARSEVREQAKSEPRLVLADDVSTTLFISIGRNRRVYPRDLIGLILQNTGIDREHIGDIRVLDNYSFVQVITEDAAKIIEVLNDFEYRGRKLAVSYSRKRDDSADGSVIQDDADERDSSAMSPDEMVSDGGASLEGSPLESGEGESDFADDEENNGNV